MIYKAAVERNPDSATATITGSFGLILVRSGTQIIFLVGYTNFPGNPSCGFGIYHNPDHAGATWTFSNSVFSTSFKGSIYTIDVG